MIKDMDRSDNLEIKVAEDKGLMSSAVSSPYAQESVGDRLDGFFGSISKIVTEENENLIYAAATPTLWVLLLLVYLGISFLTRAWHLTWLTFLGGASLQILMDLVFRINKLRRFPFTDKIRRKMINHVHGATSAIFWLTVVAVYIIFSFMTGWWEATWVLYPIASVVQVYMSLYFSHMKKKK